MRSAIFLACCLVLSCALGISTIAPAQDSPHKKEKFGALAYLPAGAGPAMVGAGARANIDIYVNSYTSDAEAKTLAAVLVNNGPDALLKSLEDAKSIGKITLSGRVGSYDLKLIRSHRTETGRRIYAIGDRPIGFLELYVSNRSRDYQFGILQIDLKSNGKGKEEGVGSLVYAAKIKLLNGNNIDVETYGIDPIRLMGVRKL